MSSVGAAPRAAVPVISARAEASRHNGAKSRGPKTPEGKARSARNALKHGLRAQKYVVLPEEDAAEFAALEAALIEELAPEGALQSVLAGRIARAAWRLERAERLEVELFEERRYLDGGPGLALIRDGNGTRSFETLLRYRGAALAELMRSLRALKSLQGEGARPSARALGTKAPLRLAAVRPTVAPPSVPAAHEQAPDEPGRRGDSREPTRLGERANPSPRASDPGAARAPAPPRPLGTPESAPAAQPSEAETKAQPGEAAAMALRAPEVRSSDLRRAGS